MPTDGRQVAVTGLGLVSPVGNMLDTFWDRIVAGQSGIGPVTRIPTDRLSCKWLAEVRDFDPADHFPSRQLTMLDRFAQFAVVAARDAVKDSGIDLGQEDCDSIPVIIGTGVGGLNTLDDNFLSLYGRDATRLPPMTIPRLMVNAGASQISMDIGLRGESYSVASACASATHAIGHAFRAIRSGDCDIAVTGGAEACLTVGTIKAWEALRVMSDEPCRPFSGNRRGMTVGEGAAILVLEELERAKARGAHIYGTVKGYGATADAGELVAPSVDGAARAMTIALRSAGVAADQVDYINAHGTGTLANDINESRAIRVALGQAADRVMISSTKAVLGHALGAAGALEAIVTLLAMDRSVVPPTANWTEADPDCDLDIIPNVARDATVRIAMSNSFAFGGLNAALVFGRA